MLTLCDFCGIIYNINTHIRLRIASAGAHSSSALLRLYSWRAGSFIPRLHAYTYSELIVNRITKTQLLYRLLQNYNISPGRGARGLHGHDDDGKTAFLCHGRRRTRVSYSETRTNRRRIILHNNTLITSYLLYKQIPIFSIFFIVRPPVRTVATRDEMMPKARKAHHHLTGSGKKSAAAAAAAIKHPSLIESVEDEQQLQRNGGEVSN